MSAEPPESHYESSMGCLLKIYWPLLGPGFLFAVIAAGVANRPALGSIWDFALGIVSLSLIGARLLDRDTPRPGTSSPESKPGLGPGKYIATVLAATLAVFVAIHWLLPRFL